MARILAWPHAQHALIGVQHHVDREVSIRVDPDLEASRQRVPCGLEEAFGRCHQKADVAGVVRVGLQEGCAPGAEELDGSMDEFSMDTVTDGIASAAGIGLGCSSHFSIGKSRSM